MGRHRTAKTAKTLAKHVGRRAYERFGMRLTDAEIHGLAKAIRAHKATFVARQSNIVTLWTLPLRDIEVFVAYDKKRGMVRTVMPIEYRDTNRYASFVKLYGEDDP